MRHFGQSYSHMWYLVIIKPPLVCYAFSEWRIVRSMDFCCLSTFRVVQIAYVGNKTYFEMDFHSLKFVAAKSVPMPRRPKANRWQEWNSSYLLPSPRVRLEMLFSALFLSKRNDDTLKRLEMQKNNLSACL